MAATLPESDSALLTPAPRVVVVIPCYRVTDHIEWVLARIGGWAWLVICVDDGCPDGSGAHIERTTQDPRVRVVRRDKNGGVGAAMVTGYQAALEAGADILVKVDGDGQMDPTLIPLLIGPILAGEADYVKGNRFYSADTVARMPRVRLLGNAGLSFLSKLSTGYWDLMDPTNGFLAVDARVAAAIPWDRIHPRWFFESDLLFRMSILRARVMELPMTASYGSERSNLSVTRALLTFPFLHARNFAKRVGYNYFLRDFSAATLMLISGTVLSAFGIAFGAWHWALASMTGTPSTAGTVMLSGLPTFLGIQMLLSFLSHDIAMTPRASISGRLAPRGHS